MKERSPLARQEKGAFFQNVDNLRMGLMLYTSHNHFNLNYL